MFVNEKLIFIQLEKTGCTHIKRLLQHFLGGAQHDKHSRIPEGFATDGRIIVGSVRNPWDWYVSMWSYGCLGQGSLYTDLTAPLKIKGHGYRTEPVLALRRLCNELSKARRHWQDCYADALDPQLFRRWLRMLHDPANSYDLMDDYAKSPMSRYAGFFTYRYSRLFVRFLDHLFMPEMKNSDRLYSVLEQDILPDFIIRNESLEQDLVMLLSHCGITLAAEQVDFIHSTYKTNPSQRERKTGYYYDPETIEMVRRRDRHLIEKYGYAAPDLD
ncbi:hypothetical protein [Methyloterricola oryzae]|uniref:hypothetical protein n=1 Tax=Methyloterricola oryzae TaxID=1495050 RepID=UPI0005EB0F6D|nr:hypothetical protein [Methyloterricola oryzae]